MGNIRNIGDYSNARVQQSERTNTEQRVHGKNTRATNPNARYNQDGDSFEHKNKKEQELRRQEIRQNAIKRAWANRILGAITAAALLTGGGKAVDAVTSPHENFNTAGHTVSDVADWTDIDVDLLLLINNIEAENADEPVQSLILPSVYSPVSDEISEIEAQLLDDSLTSSEKTKLEEELAVLTEKKEAQDEAATVYSVDGGKYAYIVANEDIGVEDIKTLFGIKDGVLKKYNELPYKWKTDTSVDVHQGYKDYSETVVGEGTILKVPQKAIGAAEE